MPTRHDLLPAVRPREQERSRTQVGSLAVRGTQEHVSAWASQLAAAAGAGRAEVVQIARPAAVGLGPGSGPASAAQRSLRAWRAGATPGEDATRHSRRLYVPPRPPGWETRPVRYADRAMSFGRPARERCEHQSSLRVLTSLQEVELASMRLERAQALRSATRLEAGGHRAGAELAQAVASNYALASEMFHALGAQPSYVREALGGPGRLLETIICFSRRGLVHLRSLATLGEREATRRARSAERIATETHAPQDLEPVGSVGLRAPGLEPHSAPEGPTRSMPRETRAGPADEDSEHPAAPQQSRCAARPTTLPCTRCSAQQGVIGHDGARHG